MCGIGALADLWKGLNILDDLHTVLHESRPVKEDGERVVPSDLVAYRKSHQFRGPHCLCLLLDDHDPSNHCEAAIVMITRGPNAGEYLACCALSKCGYVGESPQALVTCSDCLTNCFSSH